MQRFAFPSEIEIAEIVTRPRARGTMLSDRVEEILSDVQTNGDTALRRLTQELDGVYLEDFLVSEDEIRSSRQQLSDELVAAIAVARANIETFHREQLVAVKMIETMPGVTCWRRSIPISPVGLYVPGGSAALFSTALMIAIPALVAGCEQIAVCTPAGRDGRVNPTILYALSSLGIRRIFKLGGAQAIAALAFGTESVPKVHKIFGPGNQYVTTAKQIVSAKGVAIDLPAGPSEVAVLADAHADPQAIAADLLSQAEHGADSQVLVVSTDAALLDRVDRAVSEQLETLPRREIAQLAIANSRSVLVKDTKEGFRILNRYAPEHLIIATRSASVDAELVENAGSVFLGAYSPEAVGDYASGTNHTLPTDGHAAQLSGLSVDSFVKKVTFQNLTREGLERIAPTVVTMARAEGLEGHARAVEVRLGGICSK